MRAVVQRVSQAKVTIAGETTGAIECGFVVLLGVAEGDSQEDARYLAQKISGLRVFEDEQGKMNRGLAEVGGKMLVVSQLTLLGGYRKGRRPSCDGDVRSELARTLYEGFVAGRGESGI